MSGVEIHGYAIVSNDDRIADASGAMPDALRNDADWTYFQAGLDRADWIALGRVSHESAPNARGRRRLVISRMARGWEERADAVWWRPDEVSFAEVSRRLLPRGGAIAVPGGRDVFGLFLQLGYCAFHLARAEATTLPGGRGVFAGVEHGEGADAILKRSGLTPGPRRWLDVSARVSLCVYTTTRVGLTSAQTIHDPVSADSPRGEDYPSPRLR